MGGTGGAPYPVPGERDAFPAPSEAALDTAHDTHFVLAMVTGGAVYDGPLTFRVRLTGHGQPGELVVADEVEVRLAAELLPLDCRVEPAADTAR